MTTSQTRHGGPWTEKKLDALRKYLPAYASILQNRGFSFAYIDAFAGTGSREIAREAEEEGLFPFPEFEQVLKGSARIALESEPAFDQYIFVETIRKKARELEQLKAQFPDKSGKIQIIEEDANEYLLKLCKMNWSKNRAVLFLDPFGMQVDWTTIEAIAQTQAIDLWYLFSAMGVMRLIPKSGGVREDHEMLLDRILGDKGWRQVFFAESLQEQLFGDGYRNLERHVSFEAIERYVTERLASVFSRVADRPLWLKNSKRTTLFQLYFAAANPKGATTAVKIANHILQSG